MFPVRTPSVFLPKVWPLPISLATTFGISFDFSSSAYLDVSVRRVPLRTLWIHARIHGSSPWGFPHSEICGSGVYFQLTAAYRRLSRPSSALGAKAFILCSFSLEQLRSCSLKTSLLHCLSFANNCLGCVTNCLHCFSAGAFLLLWLVVVSHFSSERPFSQKIFLNIQLSVSFLFLYSVFNEHLSLLLFCSNWWAQVDSNHRPRAYQARALTS